MASPRVLITGAARGIGAETARELAARGARLSLVGLEPELLSELTNELGEQHIWFEADVTDQAALDAAVDETVSIFGDIDAVIANAGIAPFGTLATGDADTFARALEINLTGAMRTIRATAPHLIATQGYILLVSSAAGFGPVPGMGVYAASKAGVETLAGTLRIELGDRGVKVGCAHMAWIDTEMVLDAESALEGFALFRSKLPWPLHGITSVDRCAKAFAKAVEKRKRRVYVPRSIALVERSRRILHGRIGERFLRRRSREAMALLERETDGKGALPGRAGQVEGAEGGAQAG